MGEQKAKFSTATLSIIAMIIGAALGMIFGDAMSNYKFIGDIWLNCIKMVVVPLVFTIMSTSIGRQKSLQSLGRVSSRILAFYIMTIRF